MGLAAPGKGWRWPVADCWGAVGGFLPQSWASPVTAPSSEGAVTGLLQPSATPEVGTVLEILGGGHEAAGGVHKAGGFGAHGLLIGIRGEGAVGLGPGHHAPRLHAQAQRHHIGKRRRALKRHGKIAHKSTGENRIGQSHDVIFTGSLIHAGDGGGGSGHRLTQAPQMRDRVAIRSHPRTQHIQSPQHTRQRIRLGIAP
ncbi:hypothetical protein DXC72_06320 [Bifidobacterium longum]|nr:hypothetical protein DD678_08985 [Bifidobacterium longum]PVV47049.1 hypothetical protein DD701_06165 [Bifidobacterium longum]PVV59677.1 hypothetical protein DD721_02415 [Bifidobacterium longum]PVV60849.1 hypothetical protein DD705_03895 [Bifidobacterium longum]RGL20348.1 hypothetical protein DXC74_07720 [Bifidobacterium longum]